MRRPSGGGWRGGATPSHCPVRTAAARRTDAAQPADPCWQHARRAVTATVGQCLSHRGKCRGPIAVTICCRPDGARPRAGRRRGALFGRRAVFCSLRCSAWIVSFLALCIAQTGSGRGGTSMTDSTGIRRGRPLTSAGGGPFKFRWDFAARAFQVRPRGARDGDSVSALRAFGPPPSWRDWICSERATNVFI